MEGDPAPGVMKVGRRKHAQIAYSEQRGSPAYFIIRWMDGINWHAGNQWLAYIKVKVLDPMVQSYSDPSQQGTESLARGSRVMLARRYIDLLPTDSVQG